MKRIALFPGSFDPYTNGHHDVCLRALPLFDKIVIGIGVNSNKSRLFEPELIKEKLNATYTNQPNIEVLVYHGSTADFAAEIGANYILRGLRNSTDLEYENTISQANKYIFPSLETVFLITTPSLSTLSSTIVRELYRIGKDVNNYLPYKI